MDERHPKRRKDKNNTYTLSVASGRFYLSFRDGMGVLHEIEIDGDLYGLLNALSWRICPISMNRTSILNNPNCQKKRWSSE
jgi:hypothetical protein